MVAVGNGILAYIHKFENSRKVSYILCQSLPVLVYCVLCLIQGMNMNSSVIQFEFEICVLHTGFGGVTNSFW